MILIGLEFQTLPKPHIFFSTRLSPFPLAFFCLYQVIPIYTSERSNSSKRPQASYKIPQVLGSKCVFGHVLEGSPSFENSSAKCKFKNIVPLHVYFLSSSLKTSQSLNIYSLPM